MPFANPGIDARKSPFCCCVKIKKFWDGYKKNGGQRAAMQGAYFGRDCTWEGALWRTVISPPLCSPIEKTRAVGGRRACARGSGRQGGGALRRELR